VQQFINQRFLTTFAVSVVSDGLDLLVAPPRIVLKGLPPPRLFPFAPPHEIADVIVDTVTRAFTELNQGASVLREIVSPIETFFPVSPTHSVSAILGEFEKRIWRGA